VPCVDNDGVAIHYRIEGRGSPLILQHGFTDTSETLYELGYVDALKTKHQIILPDTRGHGLSDKPHDANAYTPAIFASDIVAVLNDAGVQKTAYWGYSQGGWIAFALARHARERITSFVIDGAASAGSAYRAEAGQEDPLILLLQRGAAELAGLWGDWLSPAIEGRLRANDTAALIACRRQRLVTEGYSDIGKIAVPLPNLARHCAGVKTGQQTRSQRHRPRSCSQVLWTLVKLKPHGQGLSTVYARIRTAPNTWSAPIARPPDGRIRAASKAIKQTQGQTVLALSFTGRENAKRHAALEPRSRGSLPGSPAKLQA
jgi:pimeloyl-ACP methyl ester carboxylesterase